MGSSSNERVSWWIVAPHMERAPWEPVKLQTSLTKGMSLPVSSGLPSYMHFNMAACVLFLKHTFTKHLLHARYTLVWLTLTQKKVFSAFTNCSQWGHSGFLSSQKCRYTKRHMLILAHHVSITVYNTLHYLCNKSHTYLWLSFQHFCTW